MGLADLPDWAIEPPTTSIVVETMTTVAFLYDLLRDNLDTLHVADLARLVELGAAARQELTKRGVPLAQQKAPGEIPDSPGAP
jgi:hypothetical protein